MSGPPVVASVDDEGKVIGRCCCGSHWQPARNMVRPVHGVWLDIVGMRCHSCGSAAVFTFDVMAFFEPRPGVWVATPKVVSPSV